MDQTGYTGSGYETKESFNTGRKSTTDTSK